MSAGTRETTWLPPRNSVAGLALGSWQRPLVSKVAKLTALIRKRVKHRFISDVYSVHAFGPNTEHAKARRREPSQSIHDVVLGLHTGTEPFLKAVEFLLHLGLRLSLPLRLLLLLLLRQPCPDGTRDCARSRTA